jgi:MYXO-CTERM domain-containing protein
MTYRTECGGQKFFRNKFARCGEFPNDGNSPRTCMCGGTQNSHLKLLNVFGAGTSLIPPPTVAVTTPAQSSTNANTLPANIIASAGSKRGVNRVELYLNGYKWNEVPGAAFGRTGQNNPASYGLLVPTNQLPDSVYDVEVRAYDDLELVAVSQTVTVTKGPAGGCASADTCLLGQKCEAGKCFWDPPAGEIGDACEFPQFCISESCQDPGGGKICTQGCVPGVTDSCPVESGLSCIATGQGTGICGFPEAGGCCSTSDNSPPWAPFGLAGLVLGVVIFRRRR